MLDLPKLQVGDVVETVKNAGRISYGPLTGNVVSVGRVNVKIHTRVRFSPEGPWFDQEHSIPKGHIAIVMRNNEIIYP